MTVDDDDSAPGADRRLAVVLVLYTVFMVIGIAASNWGVRWLQILCLVGFVVALIAHAVLEARARDERVVLFLRGAVRRWRQGQ